MKASEARKISDSQQPSKIVEKILERVREVSKTGKYEVFVSDFGFGDSKLYDRGESGWTGIQKEVVKQLVSLGYEACLRIDTRQLAHIFLRVSWDKA